MFILMSVFRSYIRMLVKKFTDLLCTLPEYYYTYSDSMVEKAGLILISLKLTLFATYLIIKQTTIGTFIWNKVKV